MHSISQLSLLRLYPEPEFALTHSLAHKEGSANLSLFDTQMYVFAFKFRQPTEHRNNREEEIICVNVSSYSDFHSEEICAFPNMPRS